VNAAFLFSYGFDLNILQSFGEILLVAFRIFLWEDLLIMVEVHAFGGLRIAGWGVGALCGLDKDIKRIVLLHC
jgi:hypothetical protein